MPPKSDLLKKYEEELAAFVVYECEIFSRVVGYMRPVSNWNNGKKEEWKEREMFNLAIGDK